MPKKKTKTDVVLWLMLLLVAIVLLNNYYLGTTLSGISERVSQAQEEARPVELEFTKIIDSSCTDCFNVSSIVHAIKALNVNAPSSKILEYTSYEAQQLIEQYNIEKIPALVVSGELDRLDIWSQLGGETIDGTFVLNTPVPPYRSLETGKVEGLVSLISITDSSCSDCYDVANHKSAILNYGVFLASESTYDINSTQGNEFLDKYNITIVPTVLISPEVSVYTALDQDWTRLNLGTIESDGWYVFRNTDVLSRWGNYTDLSEA